MKELWLRKGEDRRLRAGHLWVFGNEVDVSKSPLNAFTPGEEALVRDARGQALGCAFVNPHSLICARIYSRKAGQALDGALLREQIAELEALVAAGGRAAVALVSLDNADRLRYEHGQPALDQVVCTIANQWKKHYDAPGRRIVCRLHGGVLLVACKEMDAAALAGEMKRYYAEMPCDCVAGAGMMSRISFTLSIGVADTAEVHSWEELYHLCDGRLREAAAAGGNCIRA